MRIDLRPRREDVIALALAAYIAVVGIAMSYAIGAVTQAGLLIPMAAPVGVAFVLAMCWVPRRSQLIGWAALTVWLLSTTYAGHGDQEYIALVAVVVLSLLGVFKSPWFLVAVWALHPAWDLLIHRDLSPQPSDLPIGCAIYDLIVAAYIAFRTARGLLVAVDVETPVPWIRALRRTGIASYVGIVLLAQVLLVWLGSEGGWLPGAAALAAIAVVAGLSWLEPQAQSLAWVVLTAWMGMTYAHSGEALEIVVFVVIMLIAFLGYLVSPWYFVIAWTLHSVWNLVPREMDHGAHAAMGHLGTSPLASAIYDTIILIYLIVAANFGRLWTRTPMSLTRTETRPGRANGL